MPQADVDACVGYAALGIAPEMQQDTYRSFKRLIGCSYVEVDRLYRGTFPGLRPAPDGGVALWSNTR